MNNTIRVERAKKRISQEELANALNVSRQTIHSIENGKFVPSTLIALKLARYFKTRAEDIFQLDDNDVS